MSLYHPLFKTGIALIIAASASTAMAQGTLTLTPESSCVHDLSRTVVVDVSMSGAPADVVGGQFFLQYDASILTLVSAAPGGDLTHPTDPFTVQVFSSTPPPVGSVGLIDYAVGVDGGGPGTAGDSVMARLTFVANTDVCATASNLVTFRSHTPASRLTDNVGNAITPFLTDAPSIRIDSTAPTLTAPPDITVNADAGLCTYSPVAPKWRGYGGASFPGGVAELPSNATVPYSGIVYTPTTPFPFSSLAFLRTHYRMLQGCFHGGSPRFSVALDVDGDGVADGNVFVYLGTQASGWTDCPTIGALVNTGNMVTITPTEGNWDGGQLSAQGGAYGQTHAQSVAALGPYSVVGISFDVDGGWGGDQDIQVDDMLINSDLQTFDNAIAVATASDNCTVSPVVTYVRNDGHSISYPYPTGNTIITWTATDSCGNTTSHDQLVTVNAFNTMVATVQLEGVSAGPFTRCITFGLPGGTCTTFVSQTMTFTGGIGTASFDIPSSCTPYTCLTARDKLHTLRRTADAGHFGISGIQYVANFTGTDQLEGGNLNDDNVIDILDFGVFVGQYLHSYGSADTTCSTAFPNADISGDGIVFSGDFTYIHDHFLAFNEADCCGVTRPGGRASISVAELVASGQGDLAIADLNHDGWVDQADMAIFAQNGGIPTCGSADFNCDGDIGTDADIEAFFSCIAGNCPAAPCSSSADFNGDGDTGTDADIEAFFRVLAGGQC